MLLVGQPGGHQAIWTLSYVNKLGSTTIWGKGAGVGWCRTELGCGVGCMRRCCVGWTTRAKPRADGPDQAGDPARKSLCLPCDHRAFLTRLYLGEHDQLSDAISQLTARIKEAMAPFPPGCWACWTRSRG
jgi:hypothetical protein